MSLPTACMLCGLIAPLHARGLLWLCARCLPTTPPPACDTHRWRGSTEVGTWVCEICSAMLLPQEPGLESPVRVDASED